MGFPWLCATFQTFSCLRLVPFLLALLGAPLNTDLGGVLHTFLLIDIINMCACVYMASRIRLVVSSVQYATIQHFCHSFVLVIAPDGPWQFLESSSCISST